MPELIVLKGVVTRDTRVPFWYFTTTDYKQLSRGKERGTFFLTRESLWYHYVNTRVAFWYQATRRRYCSPPKSKDASL